MRCATNFIFGFPLMASTVKRDVLRLKAFAGILTISETSDRTPNSDNLTYLLLSMTPTARHTVAI